MKTIGLIGGMSWESTSEYYRMLNQSAKEALGDMHSCKCVLHSVDFGEIEVLQRQGKWEELTQIMIQLGKQLEGAGAELLIICANTMHLMADQVQSNLTIPLIHIADATAEAIKDKELSKVGLLGTRYTMEKDFYKGRILEKYGIEVIVPTADEQDGIHQVIFDELVKGVINPASKQLYIDVINGLAEKGAEGVILGCTEIPLLIKQSDVSIPVFDTTTIHVNAVMKEALK